LGVLPVHDRSLGFPRAFVGTGAVMVLLWAYPVPGSQLAFSTFFLPVAATMAGADAVATVRRSFPRVVEQRLVRALALAAVVLLVGRDTIRLRRFATESYEASVPLALPGADRLRVEPTLAASLTSLVRTLHDAPDTFLATDGFNSLYL